MFESHITVNMDKNEFIETCNRLNVKHVLITEDSGSNTPLQMMTAKFHKTDSYDTAFNEMISLSLNFKNVIRKKLEVIGKSKIDCKYEEFHSKFEVPQTQSQQFLDLVLNLGSHTAKNIAKKTEHRFVSSRNFLIHQNTISILKKKFKFLGTIHEYVVFDDNPNIDDRWVCLDCPLKRVLL